MPRFQLRIPFHLHLSFEAADEAAAKRIVESMEAEIDATGDIEWWEVGKDASAELDGSARGVLATVPVVDPDAERIARENEELRRQLEAART